MTVFVRPDRDKCLRSNPNPIIPPLPPPLVPAIHTHLSLPSHILSHLSRSKIFLFEPQSIYLRERRLSDDRRTSPAGKHVTMSEPHSRRLSLSPCCCGQAFDRSLSGRSGLGPFSSPASVDGPFHSIGRQSPTLRTPFAACVLPPHPSAHLRMQSATDFAHLVVVLAAHEKRKERWDL